MKSILSGIFFSSALILSIKGNSQISGSWKIRQCYPEVSGLSSSEIKSFCKKCMGVKVEIDTSEIKSSIFELSLVSATKIDSAKIISDQDIPDSSRYLAKFFCQELDYFNSVTKQTVDYIDSNYNKSFMKYINFICEEDLKNFCAHVYIINSDNIGLCIPGDALYCLKKVK